MIEEQDNEQLTPTIEPGMQVESTAGDLGEQDVSKPKVVEISKDSSGNIASIVVEKGAIFRKKVDIPAERVQRVESATHDHKQGTVIIDATELELEALSATGSEESISSTGGDSQPESLVGQGGLLNEAEQTIPTVNAIREMERRSRLNASISDKSVPDDKKIPTRPIRNPWFRLIGPGFLGGMAGNDASAVTAYAIDGAQNGFGHLWLLLLSTPLYFSVMYTCAKIGRITQKGLADVLREHYGRGIAMIAALILIIANVALIAADLVAIGSGLELITGLSWVWFVLPIAVILWYLTVFRNFAALKKIFVVMSLAFLAYFVTSILAKPDGIALLRNTFVPHLDLGFASISSAVALLGATVSPYNIFWQVQGEREESRAGTEREKLRLASADVSVGVISGNLVAYAIIVSTAATLFVHHQQIATATDAAQSLTQVLGPFAKYLFALGFIGAGLIAIPVLLASTSYAVAGTFGWPVGLSKKPWQNEGFYLILTFALITSLVLALFRIDPIRLMFWANVLSGVLTPILVIYLLFLANNRKVMHNKRMNLFINLGLVFTFLVMATAAILLFYGLATGQTAS